MNIAPVSYGLWRDRRRLAAATGADRIVLPFRHADTYIGWGNRPSGIRARRLAISQNRQAITAEDGFLLRHFSKMPPGVPAEPSASYIFDNAGAYYDASIETELERAIAIPLPENRRARAGAAIAEIVRTGLSKYNDAVDRSPNSLGVKGPYVLLIDQVPDDLSILHGDASSGSFEAMLAAALEENPDATVVIRGHPAARARGYCSAAGAKFQRDGRVVVLWEQCALWPLLREAQRVYTVTSHAGFEALLAGIPVTCFGVPFYAGWGLTDDRVPAPRRTAKPGLHRVFSAAYIEQSRYVDMHNCTATTLENTIDTLTCIREARRRFSGTVTTVGLSPWKRRAVAPFLVSNAGAAQHERNDAAARQSQADQTAVWSVADVSSATDVLRLEDGFIRSSGLGAELVFPSSLTIEQSPYLHFDRRGVSQLQDLIAAPLGKSESERTKALIDNLRAGGITKYMGNAADAPLPGTSRRKVLVIGQVEDDASIRLGTTNTATNTQLLDVVRARYPGALIAYRDHPDVVAGLRPGRADRTVVDVDVSHHHFPTLLSWCDRVETMTSLAGFEALLRGKPVGVHGRPFYSGWGLTDDCSGHPPRGTASLEQLVHAALIGYPIYIHPESRLPTTVEVTIAALRQQPRRGLKRDFARLAAQFAVRLRPGMRT